MNTSIKGITVFVSVLCGLITVASCKDEQQTVVKSSEIAEAAIATEITKPSSPISKEFKAYWYAGEAEISSYKLEQARYGQMRDGNAVLVFVTEDFHPDLQVKADNYNTDNIPVLKLNATKNFNTGVYPYSIMQSTFYPVSNNKHAIKISASIQEWCGQVYAQLNNRTSFEIMSHSYFQSEADQNLTLEKSITENELWSKLRIDPKLLPTGSLNVLPSLEFMRLKHAKFKAYRANAELKDGKYTLYYPELKRTLTINFDSAFPHSISGWEESYPEGYGANAKILTTKATKIKTLKSAYWGKNSNSDESLRETLGLQ